MNKIIGNLIYKITGDSSYLDKSLKKSNKEVQGFGKSLGNIGSIIKGALFTGALLIGAKKVLDFGKQLISASSDAEETQNKFSVVFQSIADDANDAALRIKDEFKLSDGTVKKFLSGVGDITSGLGATSTEALKAAEQITTLGLDINSFANLSGGAEQAVTALTSLFTGEREAAKALGIVINDTNLKAYAEDMGKVFKELTPLEKGFLSLELATQQSQLAIGDFARSADSYANTAKAAEEATKDFKSALGESLLPAATESLNIFTKLTTKLTEYVKEHNKIQELAKASAEGTLTAEQKMYVQQEKLLELRKENNRVQTEISETSSLRLARLNMLNQEAAAIKSQIIYIQGVIDIIGIEAREEQKVLDIKNEQAELDKKYSDIKKEASDTLNKLNKENLSDDEVALQNLQDKINYWVELRTKYSDVADIQEIINELVADRNELQKEEIENSAISSGAALRALSEYKDAYINAQDAYAVYKDDVLEGNEEQRISWENLAAVGLGAIASGFEDIGRALVEGGVSAGMFGKLLLNAIASTLTALGSELAAMATVQLLLYNYAAAATGYFESAAAFTASGIVKGIAASFENGGIVPGTPSKIDNTVANVASGEMILNRQQQAQLFDMANGGGGGQTRIIVNLDRRAILDAVANGTKSGELIVDARSVR